jgi:phosphoglycolate phosphatase
MVLFDIDGTLVHTQGAGRRAMIQTFADLFGIENAFSGYHFSGRTDPAILRDAFLRHFNRAATDDDFDKLRGHYVGLLRKEVETTGEQFTVMPGIEEILERLRDAGIPTGLATGNLDVGARLKLEPVGLYHYFTFGGFGSDALHRGELTAMGIEKGRRYAGVDIPAARAFIVGDSPLDIRAAHYAGALSVAVLTGWNSREEMSAEKPEYLFDDLSDVDTVMKVILEK